MIQSISKPERVYIGSAIDIRKRWALHIIQLRQLNHHSPQLQHHYNKYGVEDLEFSIIESGEYLDKNHFLSREQGWFIPYSYQDTELPYFNTIKIAGSMFGFRHSEATINKLRNNKSGIGNKSHTGRPHSAEHNSSIGKSMLGKNIWMKDRLFSGVVRDNMGKAQTLRRIRETNEAFVGIGKKRLFSQYDKSMNFIRDWGSVGGAAKELNIGRVNISQCLRGENKSAGGFVWKYKFEKEVAA